MQSFCGRIRLVTRHTINISKSIHYNSVRGFGLSSSEPNALSLNGVVAADFFGTSIDYSAVYITRLVPKFASRPPLLLNKKFGTQKDLLSKDNGMPSVAPFHRDPRPVFFQRAAVMPTFPRRCFTTMGDSRESVSQDTSASLPEAAPRIKFKRLDKTAKHIMQILDKEAVEEVRAQREIPDIKPGYIIQLKVEVPENKRRASLLKGIVIARRNAGLNTTIRLRRMVAGVGVESLLPLYSPNIKEIKVLDKKKVRRAKLYYLRDKLNPLKR